MTNTVTGPPFTVERYGSLGESIIAERNWLRAALERLLSAYEGLSDRLACHGDPPDPEAVAAREALGGAGGPNELERLQQQVEFWKQAAAITKGVADSATETMHEVARASLEPGARPTKRLIDQAFASATEKSESLQPIFTVCGSCQRKATVTSQSEVKLLGIICERTDCPGRPSQRT